MSKIRRSATPILLLLVAPILVAIAGCSQPVESIARDGIAAASGFLNNQNSIHTDECKKDAMQPTCQQLSRASHALNLTITALEVYCAGPAFDAGTGPCQPPAANQAALEQKLVAALSNLNVEITETKKVLGIAYNGYGHDIQFADVDGAAVISLISLLLPLLSQLLGSLIKSKAPTEVIDSVQGAIDALSKVHGTAVTKAQLESLKVTVPWEPQDPVENTDPSDPRNSRTAR